MMTKRRASHLRRKKVIYPAQITTRTRTKNARATAVACLRHDQFFYGHTASKPRVCPCVLRGLKNTFSRTVIRKWFRTLSYTCYKPVCEQYLVPGGRKQVQLACKCYWTLNYQHTCTCPEADNMLSRLFTLHSTTGTIRVRTL